MNLHKYNSQNFVADFNKNLRIPVSHHYASKTLKKQSTRFEQQNSLQKAFEFQ